MSYSTNFTPVNELILFALTQVACFSLLSDTSIALRFVPGGVTRSGSAKRCNLNLIAFKEPLQQQPISLIWQLDGLNPASSRRPGVHLRAP